MFIKITFPQFQVDVPVKDNDIEKENEDDVSVPEPKLTSFEHQIKEGDCKEKQEAKETQM